MATGRRLKFSFDLEQPASIPFTIGNPGCATFSVQVRLNGASVGEYSTFTSDVLPAVAGTNTLVIVAAAGGIDFACDYLPDTSTMMGSSGFPVAVVPSH